MSQVGIKARSILVRDVEVVDDRGHRGLRGLHEGLGRERGGVEDARARVWSAV